MMTDKSILIFLLALLATKFVEAIACSTFGINTTWALLTGSLIGGLLFILKMKPKAKPMLQ